MYVCFRCMNKDYASVYACKFYFQHLISVNVHGAIFPAVLMCSSRPLRWLRDGDVTLTTVNFKVFLPASRVEINVVF